MLKMGTNPILHKELQHNILFSQGDLHRISILGLWALGLAAWACGYVVSLQWHYIQYIVS